MILHFIDDSIQINHFIKRTNELFPGENLFYVVTHTGFFSKIEKAENIIPFIPTNKNIKKIVKELPDFQAVFIHNLCYQKAKIILQSPDNVVFVWGIWGFDYYHVYPELYRNIFLPYTKTINFLLLKLSLQAKNILYLLHPGSKYIGLKSPDRIRIKAAKRIEFAFNNMPIHSAVFHVLNMPRENRFGGLYYSIEYITRNIRNEKIQLGENIFIGNSASNSSNHIDLFIQLKKIEPGSKKIIVPISYGCKRYAKTIDFVGKKLFKNNFISLKQFVSLEEYNSILLSCNVMIFNHKRAQAFGNIIFGIWAGHKIFLRKTNPVYTYLKSLGIKVYSVEDELLPNNLSTLDTETRTKNRLIIEENYCEETVRKNYIGLLNALKNKNICG